MEIGGTARTRTSQKDLVDNVYMTPVDVYQARYRRWVVIALIVVVAAAVYLVMRAV